MFFFLPMRTERDTKRPPDLTIGLIALNLFVWIFTQNIVNSEIQTLGEIHERLFEIERSDADWMMDEASKLLVRGDEVSVHQKFLETHHLPEESDEYREWLSLYHQFERLKNNQFYQRWGFIPARINFLKLITSLFLHGGFWHVFGNMLFLWIVGCNLEDDWGWHRFLGFYLLSGSAAGLFHAACMPDSMVPCIGASGAVAGVMGAFLFHHFHTKIKFAYFYWILLRPRFGVFRVSGGLVLPFWFLKELIQANSGMDTGVAHWAHIGGFLFGAIVGAVSKFYLAPAGAGSRTAPAQNGGQIKDAILSNLTPIPTDWPMDNSSIEKLNELASSEPYHFEARMRLAVLARRNGHDRDAAGLVNQALDILLELEDYDRIIKMYRRLKLEKMDDLLPFIADSGLYRLGDILRKGRYYQESVKIFAAYVKWHPRGIMRARSIYQAYRILKDQLKNEKLAANALAMLRREYPDFSPRSA
ncbi:rhomboid family intramembrane serine protease [bacterium]|nr:rhomboid family intramembrane serine protease [bacterium]